MASIKLEYIAAGGNRHPSAADWVPGLLAFGAGNNIALWNPEDECYDSITALLTGHIDVVNAVKVLNAADGQCIISGSADKSVRIWSRPTSQADFVQSQHLKEHAASVNTISMLSVQNLLVTGSADGLLKIWNFGIHNTRLVQTLSLKPHYLPLTSALIDLDGDAAALAVAGTSTSFQIYVRPSATAAFELQATLVGHEGWVRSLDFIRTDAEASSNIMLASASQDKYIRLWRFHKTSNSSHDNSEFSANHSSAATRKSLSNKTQQIQTTNASYSVNFEALLIGHEDWIYTARWAPPQQGGQSELKLLSASADNSLAMWQRDESSGVWVCNTRLGEISAQKGSTTATGSTGGFWIGLWQPSGENVVSLGRTGSWRMWQYDRSSGMWRQRPGISGHTQEVRSLTWATNGSYLLSTSSDQTTRLFAEWRRDNEYSWHEFARPQIHGYDLNCIDTLSPDRFISGADEKLLRVFNEPGAIARLLSRLCGIAADANGELPHTATVPVLGLSNKAVSATAEEEMETNRTTPLDLYEANGVDQPHATRKSDLEIDHPPFEEDLSRQTLWPEHEKLYGHGYEISAVAANHNGSLVATACKASSLEHAVIRLYECQEWREVKPPLAAHTLTVTSLAFSPDDQYLLGVGRDRQWALFLRKAENANIFELLTSNPKGHSRMILDCSWAPILEECIFATAGRDKTVKIWKRSAAGKVDCVNSITAESSITAVAFRPTVANGSLRLALGSESGSLQIADLHAADLDISRIHEIPATLLPSAAINSLRWRPNSALNDTKCEQLAVASDDMSLRLLNVPP